MSGIYKTLNFYFLIQIWGELQPHPLKRLELSMLYHKNVFQSFSPTYGNLRLLGLCQNAIFGVQSLIYSKTLWLVVAWIHKKLERYLQDKILRAYTDMNVVIHRGWGYIQVPVCLEVIYLVYCTIVLICNWFSNDWVP